MAQREGVGNEEAVKYTRAAATVLQTAVTGGALEDVRSRLSDDYEEPSASRDLPHRDC